MFVIKITESNFSKHIKENLKNKNMNSFYRVNDITSFASKNVVYIAYVGYHNRKHVYKYGKSSSVYEREYLKHRKAFDTFEMQYIRVTDNKDIVENLFERELRIRKLHMELTINNKKQTELFCVNKDYDIEFITNMLDRLIRKNPSYEVKRLQERLKTANSKLKFFYSLINK